MHRTSQRQAATRARLQVEVLEGRTLPAGNVTAFLFGGDLFVFGDRADNAVEVRVVDGDLVVQGREGTGTTVNGDSRAVFAGVGRIADDLRAFLGEGNDRLDVAGLGVGGDVSIRTAGLFSFLFGDGRGADQVRLDQLAIGGDLSVSTGDGRDTVFLGRSAVAGDTTVATGDGHDRLSLVEVTLGDRLTLDTGRGDDKAFIGHTAVGGAASAVAGSGDDEVLLHGPNLFEGRVSLDGGRGKDAAEIDEATTFAGGQKVKGFKTVAEVAVTEFSPEEGLAVRRIFAGDPPGTGSTVFSLNGVDFSGGEVAARGIGELYASAPTAYVPGEGGATLTLDAPARAVRFFFTHLPGEAPATATAFDAAGNVVAVAHSNEPTFIGDPGNFVTLSGKRPIARVVIEVGMIDNVSFLP